MSVDGDDMAHAAIEREIKVMLYRYCALIIMEAY
jgi:hypothetical protein